MNQRLKSAIQGWRERRRQRRIDRLERKNIARTTLRDYKKPSDAERTSVGGPPF